MAEIHKGWPELLDCTSGHLPVPIMGDIAKAYRACLGKLPQGTYYVPSGSGETVTILRIAYPLLTFNPAYDDTKPETTRHPDAPLNAIVDGDSQPQSEEEKQEFARLIEQYGQHVTAMPIPNVTGKATRHSMVGGLIIVLGAAVFGAAMSAFLILFFR